MKVNSVFVVLFLGKVVVSVCELFQIKLPLGCPAAMICSDIRYCGLNGVISKTVVDIPPGRELYRMPLSDCRDPSIDLDHGKCCRDPEYVDPWPSSTYKSVTKKVLKGDSLNSSSRLKRACDYTTHRHYNTSPVGQLLGDANFKEFPWNILIYKKSSKFCGGTLIESNIVLTSASCVQHEKPIDLMLKAGAWRLESEMEPLKTQMRPVKAILIHPDFNNRSSGYNLAVIVADSGFDYGGLNDHINPICIDFGGLSKKEHCVVLGWGEDALKNNIKDSIVHYSNITQSNLLNSKTGYLANTDLNPVLYDIGSGLACSNDGINYYLKGVYSSRAEVDRAEFSKIDEKWIHLLYSVNFKINKTEVVVESGNFSLIGSQTLYDFFYKKTNGLFGECPYKSQRKFNTTPQHEVIGESNFQEFSWQILILKQSTKSLLCGGSLITSNVVLTTASCIVAEKPFDIVLRAGEWKLGSDIEPLQPQDQTSKAILIHPKYNGQTHENNLGAIVAENDFKIYDHISPICIEFGDITRDETCVVLGWGEQVLKHNVQESIMHYANITEVNRDYKAHKSAHSVKTDLDPYLYDFGSGLACTRDGKTYYLKGVYVEVLTNGFIQFIKIDHEWISRLFKSDFTVSANNKSFGIAVVTGNNATKIASNLNFANFYGAFFKKGNTALVSTSGSCPFPAVRRYNTLPSAGSIKEANFKEFTWQVLVRQNSTNSIICGGTLIAPNIILTTGSCIVSQSVNDLVIIAGEWELGSSEEPLENQLRNAKKTIIHPKYQQKKAAFNLGLIVVESSFEFDTKKDHISPICLEFGDLASDEHCLVLGWNTKRQRSSIKNSALNYANISQINQDYNTHPNTHWAKVDIKSSLFDMGSGLACSRDLINYYLKGVYVGILSTGYGEFVRFDLTWISRLIITEFAELKSSGTYFVGGDQGLQATSGSNTTRGFSSEPSAVVEVKPQVITKTTTHSSFGNCPYNVERKFNTLPKGENPGEANFKEFPWQVMVLKQSNKSILCGGTLIGDNIVLTSASCVASEKAYDIVIKAGEWKLGNDVEPLKYQTRTVYKIVVNPKFKRSSSNFDLAVIVIENKFKIDNTNDHISPLCIDFGNLLSSEKCVTLGWGIEALKYHLKDSIMHYANIINLDLEYKLHPVNHYGKTDLDPSLIDFGSGLACSVDGVHYHLKGVYTKQSSNGYLEFTRPDMEWISYLFSGNI